MLKLLRVHVVVVTLVALTGCGAASTAKPAAGKPTATPVSASPHTLYVLAPETGSSVGGTVQVVQGSAGATLTASVTGLVPGHTYIADADPLPCMLFVGGPSQAFTAPLTADASGNGKATWTVPSAMAGNVNVQVLTSEGAYAAVACADLS